MDIERIAAEDKHDDNRIIYSFAHDDQSAAVESVYDSYNDYSSSSHIQLKSSNDKDLKNLTKTLEHYGVAITQSGHGGVKLSTNPSEIARVRLGIWAEENLSGVHKLDDLKFQSGIQERISSDRYMPSLQKLDTDLKASIVGHVIKATLKNIPNDAREKASQAIHRLTSQVTDKYTAYLEAAKTEVENGMLLSNAVAALADAKLISSEDAHDIAADQISERGAVLAQITEGQYVDADLSMTPASAILLIQSDSALTEDGATPITLIRTRGAQTQRVIQELKSNDFESHFDDYEAVNFPDAYPKVSHEGLIKVYADISDVTDCLTDSGYIHQDVRNQIDAATLNIKEQNPEFESRFSL